jgi:hypothetical protein
VRGGDGGAGYLAASVPSDADPTLEFCCVGFRVASLVPEPGTGLLVMTGVLGMALRRKRTAKAL